MKECELPVWMQVIENVQQVKQSEKVKNAVVKSRCPACGVLENVVWVHGHGQCSYCNTNLFPCCDGATHG